MHDRAAGASDALLVVTHKGVLRASLILSLGWDMRGKAPVRYDPERALVFDLDRNGGLTFIDSLRLSETWA